MTTQDQINIIESLRKEILILFVNSTNNLSGIVVPLDSIKFGRWLAAKQNESTAQLKSLIQPAIGSADDGIVYICNTSVYSYPSFTLRIEKDKKNITIPIISNMGDIADMGKPPRWQVVGENVHGARRLRTVSAETQESAIKSALYSMKYDNKEDYTLISIQQLGV